jgi:hypothetical protein
MSTIEQDPLKPPIPGWVQDKNGEWVQTDERQRGEESYNPGSSRRNDRKEIPGLPAKFRDLADELGKGVPEAEWIGHAGLISKGTITTLGGYIGAGKTPLTLRAIRAIFEGKPFLDFPMASVPDDFKVVYLTQESEWTFLPAVQDAGLTSLEPGLFKIGYFHDFATDAWSDIVGAASRVLEGNGLLVVDTSADWARVSDENDNAQMTLAYHPLMIAVGTGIAVWVNAHTVKNFDSVSDEDATHSGIRGAGAVIANSGLVFTYKRSKPKRDGEPRHLKMQRSRLKYDGLPVGQYVALKEGDLLTVSVLENALDSQRAHEATLRRIVMEAGGRIRKKAAVEQAKLSGTNIASALAGLDGIVEVTGTGKRGDPLYLQFVDHLEEG